MRFFRVIPLSDSGIAGSLAAPQFRCREARDFAGLAEPLTMRTAALRCVAAAAEEAVFGPVSGLVERRRLRPHLVDSR